MNANPIHNPWLSHPAVIESIQHEIESVATLRPAPILNKTLSRYRKRSEALHEGSLTC